MKMIEGGLELVVHGLEGEVVVRIMASTRRSGEK